MGKRKRNTDGENQTVGEPESLPKFEDSLAKLQSIISELESGKLTLDDSLQRYEAGIEQLRLCHRSLAQVEQRIRVLVSVDDSGQATTKPFEHQASFDGQSNRPAAKGIHADVSREPKRRTSVEDAFFVDDDEDQEDDQ